MTKEARIYREYMEKRQSLELVVLGILGSYMSKNEIRTFPYIMFKNKLKFD